MSYGKIYESSWWGIGVSTNTISWGIVYAALASTDAIEFQERGEADGGTVESLTCLQNAVNAFPAQDEGRVLFEAYDTRVTTDSGTTEGRQCTIDAINNLREI